MNNNIKLCLVAILLCTFISPFLFTQTASADQPNLFRQSEIYHQLAAGERIMQAKEYQVPEQPTVYLSFDDGPSHLTPIVLDILAAEDIRASFFALGRM